MDDLKYNETQKAILKVIAFFDLFEHAPSEFEIFKFISIRTSLLKTSKELLKLVDLNKLVYREGSFALLGRESLFKEKKKRYLSAESKLKKAHKIAFILRAIPWIRSISIANVVGENNFKENSDIDLFVVCLKHRIWLTRLFSVLIIMTLGLRPQKNNHKDKICLSFYLSEDNLSFSSIMIENDIYFKYWSLFLIPIYEARGLHNILIEKNDWIKNENTYC